QRERGQGLNLAVFSPSLGTSHPLGGAEGGGGHGRWGLRSPSPSSVPLTINSVRLEDEGKYSCEYSLFPQGKNGGQTSLTVWGKTLCPLVSVSRLPVWAGDSRRPVAECSASNGKPGAEITWVSDFPGNTSTRETRNPNGTQSLTSRYFLVPTHNQHNRLITCSVTHPTLTRPKLMIFLVSAVVIADISLCSGWGGDLPKSVRVDSDRVFLNAVDISVNSTFRCEATNTCVSVCLCVSLIIVNNYC
uniref:Ig-like domain-containing protein n=1 Tax=Callorhinchus milii TaxID=7868 RepID=A0A4W3GZ74_CALMI